MYYFFLNRLKFAIAHSPVQGLFGITFLWMASCPTNFIRLLEYCSRKFATIKTFTALSYSIPHLFHTQYLNSVIYNTSPLSYTIPHLYDTQYLTTVIHNTSHLSYSIPISHLSRTQYLTSVIINIYPMSYSISTLCHIQYLISVILTHHYHHTQYIPSVMLYTLPLSYSIPRLCLGQYLTSVIPNTLILSYTIPVHRLCPTNTKSPLLSYLKSIPYPCYAQ